eukprot:ctg_1424.g431
MGHAGSAGATSAVGQGGAARRALLEPLLRRGVVFLRRLGAESVAVSGRAPTGFPVPLPARPVLCGVVGSVAGGSSAAECHCPAGAGGRGGGAGIVGVPLFCAVGVRSAADARTTAGAPVVCGVEMRTDEELAAER